MKINWHPNPLNTTIDLDDQDREILRLKIIIENLEDRIYGAHFRLESGKRFDPDAARKELHIESLEEDALNARISEMMQYHIEELSNGVHVGDCTCVPCSCLKCHAEELLGVHTIKGLGKHPAAKMNSAFAEGRTLDEAIAWLENYNPQRSEAWMQRPQEDFDIHIPRWIEESRHAAKWLREYQKAHFQND